MRISNKNRDILNKSLFSVLEKTYFDYIPMQDIFNAFKNAGFTLLQEDNTEWGGFICGSNGREIINYGYTETKDKYGFYKPVQNSMFVISWYKMDNTGRFEVIGYIS